MEDAAAWDGAAQQAQIISRLEDGSELWLLLPKENKKLFQRSSMKEMLMCLSLTQASPASCWCIHVPAAPGNYWGYSSGLMPQRVTTPSCSSLPFTLLAGVVVPSPGKPPKSLAEG